LLWSPGRFQVALPFDNSSEHPQISVGYIVYKPFQDVQECFSRSILKGSQNIHLLEYFLLWLAKAMLFRPMSTRQADRFSPLC